MKNKQLRLFSKYIELNSTVIERDCEVSVRFSSQQPPGIYSMSNASAVNRTRLVGSVTCARHRLAVSSTNGLDQGWATYGPRDHFMRPAGSYKKINRTSEGVRTFFALHRYFRRKTGHCGREELLFLIFLLSTYIHLMIKFDPERASSSHMWPAD